MVLSRQLNGSDVDILCRLKRRPEGGKRYASQFTIGYPHVARHFLSLLLKYSTIQHSFPYLSGYKENSVCVCVCVCV